MQKDDIKKINVLIVEEQALTQTYLRHMLEEQGFRHIVITETPRSALRAMEDTDFELVLCAFDFSRGKDGYQFFEQLKAEKRLSPWSVFIFISAETSPSLVRGVVELEPDDYLLKPFNSKVLHERLRKALVKKFALKDVFKALQKDNETQALKLINDKLLAERKDVSIATLLKLKGEILLHEQRFNEAEFFYQAILKQQKYTWAQLGLVHCLVARHEVEQALQILSTLTEKNSHNLTAFDVQGALLFDMQDYQQAQQAFMAAAELSPRNTARQDMVVDLSRLNHDYSSQYEARRSQLKYGRLSIHDSPDLYLNAARAGIDYALSIDDDEDSFRVTRQIGEHLAEIEKLPNAGQVSNEINTVRARVHYLKNEKDKALKILRDVSDELDNQGPESLLDRAKAFHELGLHNQAMDVLSTLSKQLNDLDNVSPAFASYVHQEAKEREDIKHGPRELNNIAAEHFRTGNAQLAYHMFAQALTIMPNNTRVALNLLQVLCERFSLQELTFEQQEMVQRCQGVIEQSELDEEQQRRHGRLNEMLERA